MGNKGKVDPPSGILGFKLINRVLANELSSFCLIENLGWGYGGPVGRDRWYRGGIGNSGLKCNAFIVRGIGAGSCHGSTLFLVGALGGPVSR